MANESYTLIIVPHAKARFRKLQVSVRLTKWVAGVFALAALGLVGMLGHYGRISLAVKELERLRVENKALLARTSDYEQNAGKLQAKVQTLERMVDKLGVMAGLEPGFVQPASVGVGGLTGPASLNPPLDTRLSLQTMDRSLSLLSDQSARLEAFYRDQTLLLASTPSVWPVRGYLSAAFGNRPDPFTGRRDFHPGLDISAPVGTRVSAPADGVVVSAAWSGGYGNALVVDHGFGIVTRYAHLQGFAVKPGHRIRRGDLLGYVGNTGRSTGPHLHYEVWVRDQAQNPIHFILDEYRSFG